MRRFIPLLLCVFMMFGFGQPLRQKIAAGNAHFEKGEYEDALTAYTDAQLHDPHSPALFFNMGDVLYGQRKYNEAGAMYEKAREKGDPRLEFESLYNSGCTLYRQGKLKESLDMFKQALAKDPKDEDAKYNVEFVEQKIKEMLNQAQKRMEQQQQSGSQKDQKNEQSAGQGAQQNPEEKKDEQKEGAAQAEQKQGSDQEKEKGEEQKAETGDQKEPKTDQEQQQSAPKDKSDQQNKDQAQQGQQRAASDKEMSKEEAERYLDMLAMDDKMQQPAQEQPKTPYGNYRLEKDW
jgi:Ca-activated chloride channel homolog